MTKPPIIVYSWGDIHVFQTIEEVQSHLEPADVDAGEYLLFDSEGRILEAVSVDWNQVVVREATPDTRFTPQLRHRLTWFLERRNGLHTRLDKASLDELIREVASPRQNAEAAKGGILSGFLRLFKRRM